MPVPSVEATITSNCYLSDLRHPDGRISRLAELRLWVVGYVECSAGPPRQVEFILDTGAPASFICVGAVLE